MKDAQLKLTDNFFAFYGILVALSILGLTIGGLSYLSGLFLVLLVIGAVVDLFTLPKDKVESYAELSKTLTLDQNVEIPISVHWNPQINNCYSLHFANPNNDLIEFSELNKITKLKSKFQNSVRFKLLGKARKLGYSDQLSLMVAVTSKFRLWRRLYNLDIEIKGFRVSPALFPVDEQSFQEIVKRQPIFISGSRRKMRGGSPDLYLTSRPYRFPDPIRHIDHKKSAKFNELMTRTFESELNQNIVIAYDCGRSLQGSIEDSYKHDYYLSASMLIIQQALKLNDNISFFSFSNKVTHTVKKAKNINAFNPLFASNATMRPQAVETDLNLIIPTVQRLSPQRSIVFILSDSSKPSIQTELPKVVKQLTQKHVVVMVSLLDNEFNPSDRVLKMDQKTMKEDEMGELIYSYWMNHQIDLLRLQINRLGGGLLSIPQREWMTVISRTYHLLRSSLNA